jgi:hypothetical protein
MFGWYFAGNDGAVRFFDERSRKVVRMIEVTLWPHCNFYFLPYETLSYNLTNDSLKRMLFVCRMRMKGRQTTSSTYPMMTIRWAAIPWLWRWSFVTTTAFVLLYVWMYAVYFKDTVAAMLSFFHVANQYRFWWGPQSLGLASYIHAFVTHGPTPSQRQRPVWYQ